MLSVCVLFIMKLYFEIYIYIYIFLLLPVVPIFFSKVLDDVEPVRRPARDNDGSDDGDARTAYLQPSLKAEPFARPELERDHQANIDFERFRGRV